MVTKRVDANTCCDDTDVNGNDKQRNTGNRVGQFREILLATEHRLHDNLRKHDEKIKAQQIQRLLVTSSPLLHL